jgi:hypothetical protein
VITGVTAGGVIAISCSGLPKKTTIVAVEASALAGLVASADSEDEADVGDLGLQLTSSTGTLAENFKLPTTFVATDPSAQCPPTQAQVNAGLGGCSLSLATFAEVSYGTVTLDYTTQPSPQPPTLALSPTSASAGQQVSVSDGAGPGSWWGSTSSVTSLSSSDISIGGVAPADVSASISATTYSYPPGNNLGQPRLSGSFVVPCGVPSSSPSVTVTEANTTGFPGTVTASAPLTVVGGGTTPAITNISPTVGNPTGDTTVTITGCNFDGVTSVMFGSTPAVSFTIDSDTQITAIAPPGTGQVNVILSSSHGTSPVSIATAFSYGQTGYTLAGSDGGVFNFGGAFHGSLPASHVTPAKPIVGIATTSGGGGYWLAGSDGGVFSYGNAGFHGSLAGRKLDGPIVGIAAAPDGGGYWLVGSDGGVFSFGSATFHGSLGGHPLAKPIVGIAAAPDGNGYWLVGSDGGVFAFGSATFHGSLAGHALAQPVVGIAPTSDGGGYWLTGSDGGVFGFGSATFDGSMAGHTLSKPVVGIVGATSGGYDLVGSDGGVYAFDTPFGGSLSGRALTAPIVGGASG